MPSGKFSHREKNEKNTQKNGGTRICGCGGRGHAAVEDEDVRPQFSVTSVILYEGN